MTDRDKKKVIEQLEKVSDYFFSIWRDSKSENYCNRMKEMDDTVKDAITLLQPLKRKDVNGEMYYKTEDGWDFKGFCPACNAVVRHISNREFCGSCGQALKWAQIVFPEEDNKVPVQSLIDHIKTATTATACSESAPGNTTLKDLIERTDATLAELNNVLGAILTIMTGDERNEINNKEPSCCMEAVETMLGRAETALKAALKIRSTIA